MIADRYPTDCWLTPYARVDLSTIEGKGLSATAPIYRGDVVIRLGGQLIDDATLGTLAPPYSSLTIRKGLNLLLDPSHPVRYGNHSCDPNLWHADATTVVARRLVTAGEELTIDYATHTGIETWTMACQCRSAICRGNVTGRDWRLPQLQDAYGDHWSPPLLDRIHAEVLRRAPPAPPGG